MGVGDGTADNRHMGKYLFALGQNVTKSRAVGNRMYRPLERIAELGSMRTTAERLKSTTRSS